MSGKSLENSCGARGKNVVLIGMPGVGKSTVGVLLAKQLGLSFLDTDLIIQAQEGKHLKDIIKEGGMNYFCEIEERYILSVNCQTAHVIATGGSVVYSPKAMEHLGSDGFLIFLNLKPESLQERLHGLDARGVVRAPGQSVASLFIERRPLYQKYADVTIDCEKLRPDQVVTTIMERLPG